MRQRARVRRPARSGEAPAETVVRGAPQSIAVQLDRGRPLRRDDVLALQHRAGNRAVTLAVQRQPVLGRPARYTRANRPKRGADVRSALRAQLPGLLNALTEDQITRWQRVVDYYAVTRHINRELNQLHEAYMMNVPGLADPRTGGFTGIGTYNDEQARILRGAPKPPPEGEKLTVDPNLMLAADVSAEPEWDVAAETEFRRWAVAELAKSPPVFDMFPEYDDEIITRRTSLGSYSTKGVITLADLRHRFRDEYARRVTNRADWQKLQTALDEAQASYNEATELHKERSKINKDNAGVFGIDIVRNIIEVVGDGDQDYPTMAMWAEPKNLLERARPALREQKMELALPLVAMAELATAQAAEKIFAYDARIESGARVAVKWLGRVKTVGSVAAGIAAGPLGVTGSALVAGGYTFTQEGLQNVSAMAHGQRTDLGLASLVKQAGVATVLGMLGGPLQGRFQAAMAARLSTAARTGFFGQVTTSMAASMTSSLYTTAAEIVLGHVVAGTALPRNATELADLIADKALEAGAMDVALRGPSARAAREYQAWKAGKARAVVPQGGVPATLPAARPADHQDPRRMPEDVTRRLLRESGGWERLSAELHAGTGLGHGLTAGERRAMLDRFEASRELLARDVGGMFGGTVTITDPGAGRQVEVRFLGDAATQHMAQAQAYLDVKRPGWAAETGVALVAGPRATAASPKSYGAIRALEHATPEARQVAAELAPLFETWGGVSAQVRLERLVAVLNRQLRAAGIPEVHGAPLARGSGNDAEMSAEHWELQVDMALLTGVTQTPEQFARVAGLVMHEGWHARQFYWAARTNPAMARNHVDPAIVAAAEAANRVAPLNPASLAHAEGVAIRDSIWDPVGRQNFDAVYARMAQSGVNLNAVAARAAALRTEARGSPIRDAAARELWAARTERDRAHDAYMNLPEEVLAWRTGMQTEAAVKERLRLDRLIATARAGEARANDAYRAQEDRYLAPLVDPALPPPTAAAQRAFTEAMRRHQRAMELVRKLERARADLATRGVVR